MTPDGAAPHPVTGLASLGRLRAETSRGTARPPSARVRAGRLASASGSFAGETARLAGAALIVSDNARHFAPLMRHDLAVLTAQEFADTYL